jgi:hypothetical protein
MTKIPGFTFCSRWNIFRSEQSFSKSTFKLSNFMYFVITLEQNIPESNRIFSYDISRKKSKSSKIKNKKPKFNKILKSYFSTHFGAKINISKNLRNFFVNLRKKKKLFGLYKMHFREKHFKHKLFLFIIGGYLSRKNFKKFKFEKNKSLTYLNFETLFNF